MEPGLTPGLRVPLRRIGREPGFLLLFGPGGVRIEQIGEAQAMALLSDIARELGLHLSGPRRPPS
jgi:hypothetical protein